MSPDEIAQLRALEQAATPGPWAAVEGVSGNWWIEQPNRADVADLAANGKPEPDAALIAATRNALPGLLDAAEEAVTLRENAEGVDLDWRLLVEAKRERDALRAELDALRGRVAGLADRMTIELAGDIERRDEAGYDDYDYWNGVVGGSSWQAQALRNVLDGPA